MSKDGHPPPPPRSTRIEISTTTIAIVLCIGLSLWLLTQLWPIVLVLIAALILVGTLSPAVAALERRKLKRGLAVAIVFVSVGVAVGLLALILAPPLSRQLIGFVDGAPALQQQLATFLSDHRLTTALAGPVRHFQLQKLVTSDGINALAYSTAIVEFVGYVVTAIVLSLYFLADRDRTRGALFAVVPRIHHMRLARVLLQLETIVGGYMRGQLITSLLITAFTFVLLSACRVPGALALAAFAGLTDTIPFVGGLLATVPAVLAAASRGSATAAIVCCAMIAYQEVESRIIVPRIYGKALRLPAAAVVISLLIGGKLLGIVGALLALPIAAALRMLVDELRVDLPGDDSIDSAQVARDARAEATYARETSGAAPSEAAAVAVAIVAAEPAAQQKH